MGNLIETASSTAYSILEPNIQAMEANIIGSWFGEVKVPQILQKGERIKGRESVTNFLKEMEGDFFDNLARSYIKDESALDGLDLSCRPYSMTVADGLVALSLWAVKNGGKVEMPVCQTSFADLTWLSMTKSKKFGRQPLPVIMQLQGGAIGDPSGEYDPALTTQYKIARQVLSGLRWEPLLVELIMLWAVKEGYPALYSLPARLNGYWQGDDEARCQTFKMRYDVTLQRMGFRMQSNGLWGISLLGASWNISPKPEPQATEAIQHS